MTMFTAALVVGVTLVWFLLLLHWAFSPWARSLRHRQARLNDAARARREPEPFPGVTAPEWRPGDWFDPTD